VIKLKVQLQLPLLYMAERESWFWHKKWTLPKLHVHVSCNGKPVGGPFAAKGPSPGGEPPVYAVITAGTLRDGSDGIGLYDQGLGGECQRRLMLGQTTFSSLLFKHTSFNCDSRPFHLVVTVLAPASHPLAIAALASGEALAPADSSPAGGGGAQPEQMVALACMCSSPIIVDARKRTKGERPDADASDVRLVLRQRSSMPQQPKPSVLLPFAGLGGGGPIGSAQGQQMWLPPQPQFASQAPASTAQLQPLQQQQFYTHVLPPHTNAAKPPAQLGVVVAAPIRVFSAVPEPIGEVVEACGDALIELQDTFVVSRLLGKNVFGYEPTELVGRSILGIFHPDDHESFVQTARALLAMAAGSLGLGLDLPPQSVRVMHRVFVRREGQTFELMVDSIITAKRPDRMGAEAGLIMSSRCALPFPDDGGAAFRVFPVGGPNQGRQGR